MASEPRRSALKVLISVFIVYHLAAVLLMLIGSSLAGRKLARFFLPYVNTLGFNSTWQGFSPGPSPMFYLQYEPDLGGDEVAASEPTFFPPKRAGFTWSDGWSRRLFSMRFLATNPELMERFLVPFLCRQSAGARSIDVQSIVDQVEPIDRPDEMTEFTEMTRRLDLPRQKYTCPEMEGV